jgi:hypothetical protein
MLLHPMIVLGLAVIVLQIPFLEACYCDPAEVREMHQNLCHSDFVGLVSVKSERVDKEAHRRIYEIEVRETWRINHTSSLNPTAAITSLDPEACGV